VGQAVTTLERLCEFFKFNISPADVYPLTIPNSNRERLAEFFAYAGFANGAEVGVESGRYSHTLLSANPAMHLYCVDPWLRYESYREHVPQAQVDGMLKRTRERLKGFNVTIVRKFSTVAAQSIEDGSLDFVYVDANHAYDNVIEDIAAWLPKIRSGGIIAGHDYAPGKLSGMPCDVIEAVNNWTSANQIAPWFLVGHQGVAQGDTRPRPQSWLWVKD
jgi:hypothetical protein